MQRAVSDADVTRAARSFARHFILLAVIACTTPAWAQENYSARLATVPIDFQSQAATTGSGQAMATLNGAELTVSGSFEGLQGPATTAWLHVGPALGTRGPAAHELEVTRARDGSVSGRVTLSRDQLAALASGRMYLQIHSEAAPDGNLWGWLL